MKNVGSLCIVALVLISSPVRSQWVQMKSPNGAFVPALAAVGSSIFAGTGDGVYRSTNGGAVWAPVNMGLTSRLVTALAVVDTVLFTGTFSSGVFRSTDYGGNWIAVDSGLTNLQVTALVVKGRQLFAGTRGGVFRTMDNGLTWTESDSGLPTEKTIVAAFAVQDGMLFAGIPRYGIFRSTDDGEQWVRTSNGLPSDLHISSLAVVGANIVVGTDMNGIFRSTNNGGSWIPATAGPDNSQIFSLAVGPRRAAGTMLLAGTLSGVYLSSDSGNSWRPSSEDSPVDSPVLSLLVTDSSFIAGTNLDGIFVSTDAGTRWVATNAGFLNTYLEFLGNNGSSLFAGARSLGLFRSIDSGTTWVAANGGLPASIEVRSFTSRRTDLFLGTSNGVYRSSDNGINWTGASAGLPLDSRVEALVFADSVLFAGTLDSGIFRSSDNGVHWAAASSGLTFKGILTFAASGVLLFAGGLNGVYRSTNGGTEWEHAGLAFTVVQALAAPDTNLFAALVGGGLYRSEDFGVSWSSSSTGIPTYASVGSLVAAGNSVFAATSAGVYLSTSSGRSWSEVNNGLTNSITPVLAASGPSLFAGTYGSGIWRRPLSEMITSVESEGPDGPMSFSLEQNYPNPFNPKTVVSSQLPVASEVKLAVYDLLGREVVVLVDGRRAAGSYHDTFDASALASGVYFYRLQARPLDSTKGRDSRSGAGTFVDTKKLMLVR